MGADGEPGQGKREGVGGGSAHQSKNGSFIHVLQTKYPLRADKRGDRESENASSIFARAETVRAETARRASLSMSLRSRAPPRYRRRLSTRRMRRPQPTDTFAVSCLHTVDYERFRLRRRVSCPPPGS